MGGGSSVSEAASLVFRIATVGLSLASAIMTAASTQCVYRDNGVPAGTVSYSDYNSFKYSAIADLLSAVLQGVAIYLEATRKERAAKAVELIDKLVQALTATSAALLLAVDDITSCGGSSRSGGSRGREQRQSGGLCGQAGAFCSRVRVASAFSIAATVSVSASVYTRHAPVAAMLAPRPPPPPPSAINVYVNVERRDEGRRRKKKEKVAEEKTKEEVETKDTKEEEEKEKKEEEVVVIVPEEKTEEMKAEEDTEKGKEKEDDQVKKDDEGGKEKKKDDEVEEEQCRWSTLQIQAPPATMMPPPWCRCPRLTIPCDCEDPELCGAFF